MGILAAGLWGFPLLRPSCTCKWPPPAMPPGAFGVRSCSGGSSWQNRPRRWLLRGSRNLFSAYLFVMARVRLRCREVGQLLRAISAANSERFCFGVLGGKAHNTQSRRAGFTAARPSIFTSKALLALSGGWQAAPLRAQPQRVGGRELVVRRERLGIERTRCSFWQ